MKMLYMGTAAAEGWPALFCSCPVCEHARRAGGKNLRTRTQALLDNSLLIDFPPDTYCHALRYGLNLGDIHTLLITHSHMDHWFPTDLIHRHEHFGHGATGVLDVYGNEAVEKSFYENLLIDRFKPHPIDDVVRFHVVRGGDRFWSGGWEILAVPADHDKREESLVYICKKDGKTVFYGHDTGCELSRAAWDLIAAETYSLVSLDATMGQKTAERYHMGLPDAERMFRKLEELGCIDAHTVKVVSHFSHNGEMSHEELTAWGAVRGIRAAYDGMEAEF
ncbi:MAG TPA: MBL fold metallo-hydrolase [Candidatus Ventrimonas merdavium]|nr:MBL fold metallo-hydrolase [Candidatus Ventrimonas merdavium]